MIMVSKMNEHVKRTCEEAVGGTYDDEWGYCAVPDLKKILVVTGFGHVRDQTRKSEEVGKVVTVKDTITTGKREAIVRGKGFGYESLYQVPIGNNLYNRWVDMFKVKPELEGKKSKIVTTKIDVGTAGDWMRIYIDVNEPAMNAWNKRNPLPEERRGQFITNI